VPELSASEVVMTIEEVKKNQSPGTDQIPVEMIKAGSRTICSEIHELINSIWNKEELPEKWKELINVPLHKKGDKTQCSNYRGISLSSTMYNILSNLMLSKLTPNAEGITWGSSMWIST